MTYAQYLAAKLAAEKEDKLDKATLSKGQRRIPYSKTLATLGGGLLGLGLGANLGIAANGGKPGAGMVLGGITGAVLAGIIARKATKEHYAAVSPYEVVD